MFCNIPWAYTDSCAYKNKYIHCVPGVFFFKQKTAYEIMPSLVGSEMCIRDRNIGNARPMKW